MSTIKHSPYFALLAEFGTAYIPVTEVGKKFFGYDEKAAKQAATENRYPFPVMRVGSNKSPWVVDAAELAKFLEDNMEKAKKEFKQVRLSTK